MALLRGGRAIPRNVGSALLSQETVPMPSVAFRLRVHVMVGEPLRTSLARGRRSFGNVQIDPRARHRTEFDADLVDEHLRTPTDGALDHRTQRVKTRGYLSRSDGIANYCGWIALIAEG